MKAKSCTGQGCTYVGVMYQSKPLLCRNCSMKSKLKVGDQFDTMEIVSITTSDNSTHKVTLNKPKLIPVKQRKPKDEQSIQSLLKLSQICFNAYIRKRDSQDGMFTCISSGKYLPISQMQAGHLYPVSTASAIRFDEDNVHGQSVSENCFNPDHQHNYLINIIKKIGKKRVERLDALAHTTKHWSKEELLEIIKKYK